VEVDCEFKPGSFIIPVHIFSDTVIAAEHLLTGEAATALVNLMQLVGFSGIGVTLYQLFKRLKGRRIEKPEDIPKELNINLSIEILIRIYNDPEVQAELRRAIDPLHQEGIEEFQTRRQGIVIETVSKKDLHVADEAELEDLTRNEEIDLDIEKAAWRRSLAWHFSDGRTSFDAKIEDERFWKKLKGARRFRTATDLEFTCRRLLVAPVPAPSK
jgi:hypothetical protein